MREWVGVEKPKRKKASLFICVQGFQTIFMFNPPALFAQTGFQAFRLFQKSVCHAMILPSALQHLENQIQQGF